MEYVVGESLQERLDRAGPLAVADIVRIGHETALGLAAAHAVGLIHRDIKPANLLLERATGRVKITDFGLARLADDIGLTQSGVVAGTPEYMAPEQACGETVDHRADLFSLGSVLYALCAGVPPFRGAGALEVLRLVREQEPVALRSLRPAVPAKLGATIGRLLAKDPAARCQSAREVAEQLSDLGAPARAPSCHGRWLALAFGSLGALCLVLLLVALARTGSGPGPLPQPPANPAAPAVRLLQGHTGPVHNILFTADGRLVSASGWPQGDRTVRIWDVAAGRQVRKIDLPGTAHSLDLDAAGRCALVGLNNGVVVYVDLDTGQLLRQLKLHSKAVSWVAFGRDGQHGLSTSDEGHAKHWRLSDGMELAMFRTDGPRARGGVQLPDGRLLTGDNAGLVQLWDIATAQEVQRFPVAGRWMINALQLSTDGRQVLVAGVGGVCMHEVDSGKEVRRFQQHHEGVNGTALSPDERHLLTAGNDGAVRLWDFRSGELLRVLGNHNGFVFSVAFAPDGKSAASGGGGERKDGNFVAGTDHAIRLWDLAAEPAEAPAPRSFWGRGRLVLAVLVLLMIALSCFGLCCYVWQRRRAARRSAREKRRA
jgi:sugar lactone lactonase YvrE